MRKHIVAAWSVAAASVMAFIVVAAAAVASADAVGNPGETLQQRMEPVKQALGRINSALVRKEDMSFTADMDWIALGEQVLGLGQAFPEDGTAPLRSLSNQYFLRAERYAPEAATTTRERMLRNANPMLRDLAAGAYQVEEARRVPMQMRFTAIDGREVDLSALRGKVVLLDFRGVTWCGACRGEEPYMKEAYAKYHDKGFEIITITYESKPESRDFVLNYTRERDLVWPHYFDGRSHDNPYIRRFGITGVPQHFLLDRSGLIASTDVRGRKLMPAIERLLQEGESPP